MNPSPILLTLAALTFVVVPAAAHPSGVQTTSLSGTVICYVYDEHETNTRELWIESNGYTSGGVPEPQEWFGVPALDGRPGSGLQRTAFFDGPDLIQPDARVDPLTWISFCTL